MMGDPLQSVLKKAIKAVIPVRILNILRIAAFKFRCRLLNVRFHMHSYLGQWQFSFFIYKLFNLYQEYVVTYDTDLMIEGYPRTASSFCYHAFHLMQKCEMSVAYHLHSPAHVLRAIKMQVPTVVLIRDPRDAVASSFVREPYMSIGVLLTRYWIFYRTLLPFRHRFVVADFAEVTTDFGSVIDRINDKYNANFLRFEHTAENLRRVSDELKRRDSVFGGPAQTSYRPNAVKDRAKLQVNFTDHKEELADCQSLHRHFLDLTTTEFGA